MDRAPFHRCTANQRAAVWADRVFRQVLDVRRLGIVGSRYVIPPILQLEEDGIFGFAQTPGCLKDGIKNRLQLGG